MRSSDKVDPLSFIKQRKQLDFGLLTYLHQDVFISGNERTFITSKSVSVSVSYSDVRQNDTSLKPMVTMKLRLIRNHFLGSTTPK